MRKEKTAAESWDSTAWHFKWLARYLIVFAILQIVVMGALIADDMNWIDWK